MRPLQVGLHPGHRERALMQITGPGLDPIRVGGLYEEGPFDTFARLGLVMV